MNNQQRHVCSQTKGIQHLLIILGPTWFHIDNKSLKCTVFIFYIMYGYKEYRNTQVNLYTHLEKCQDTALGVCRNVNRPQDRSNYLLFYLESFKEESPVKTILSKEAKANCSVTGRFFFGFFLKNSSVNGKGVLKYMYSPSPPKLKCVRYTLLTEEANHTNSQALAENLNIYI